MEMGVLDYDDLRRNVYSRHDSSATRDFRTCNTPEKGQWDHTIRHDHSNRLSVSQAIKLRRDDAKLNQNIYAEHEKQDWSAKGILHRTIYRPFYMLYKEPILVLVTIYLSIVYGILYAREQIQHDSQEWN